MSRLDDYIEALRQRIDTEAEARTKAAQGFNDHIENDLYLMGLGAALHEAEVHQGADFQHEVRVTQAFDCIEVQPCVKGSVECGSVHGKSHGRGAATITFAAYTLDIEVALVVDTAWHHPSTPVEVRQAYAGFDVMHSLAQVTYHTWAPGMYRYSGNFIGPVRAPGDCPRGWAECYSDVQFEGAREGVDTLITGGTAALWPWLADRAINRLEGTN